MKFLRYATENDIDNAVQKATESVGDSPALAATIMEYGENTKKLIRSEQRVLVFDDTENLLYCPADLAEKDIDFGTKEPSE